MGGGAGAKNQALGISDALPRGQSGGNPVPATRTMARRRARDGLADRSLEQGRGGCLFPSVGIPIAALLVVTPVRVG